jgi:hypothetical protein
LLIKRSSVFASGRKELGKALEITKRVLSRFLRLMQELLRMSRKHGATSCAQLWIRPAVTSSKFMPVSTASRKRLSRAILRTILVLVRRPAKLLAS